MKHLLFSIELRMACIKAFQCLLCILLFHGISNLKAQDNGKKTFITGVRTIDKTKNARGYLGELKTSSLTLYTKQDIITGGSPSIDLRIDEIRNMKFNRRGGITKGALIGSAIGFTLGLIAGDDEECSYIYSTSGNTIENCEKVSRFKYLGEYVVSGAVLGGIFGGFLGLTEIPLNGNQKTYEQEKSKMHKFLY